MAERIQPVVNRNFTGGPGNWAGDLGWDPGIICDPGYIYVHIEDPPEPKTITLAYPYIKFVPGVSNYLAFYLTNLTGPADGFTLDYGLTDGVYSYEVHAEGTYDSPLCQNIIAWNEVLPDDWNPETSYFFITVSMFQNPPGDLGFDDFTLQAEVPGKTDHLPLMGVH